MSKNWEFILNINSFISYDFHSIVNGKGNQINTSCNTMLLRVYKYFEYFPNILLLSVRYKRYYENISLEI